MTERAMRGWVRRDFGAAGLSQYPPGPHLKAWPQQAPAEVRGTDDAPADVPSTDDARGADAPWTDDLSTDAPANAAAGPELLVPSPRKGFGFFPSRLRHYGAGAYLALAGMAAERPDLAAAFAKTCKSDIVVAEGRFDRVQDVLDLLGLPYTLVGAHEVSRLRLEPEQILIVNCPGEVGAMANLKIRRFVRAGGTLLATDWALRSLVQLAFPGMVAHNGMRTADTVVGIRPSRTPHPLLMGAFDDADDAQWWLEAGSYPILVLARGG